MAVDMRVEVLRISGIHVDGCGEKMVNNVDVPTSAEVDRFGGRMQVDRSWLVHFPLVIGDQRQISFYWTFPPLFSLLSHRRRPS